MAKSKTVTVLINDDGTMEFDQEGWTGKSCSGEIQDLINALGKEKTMNRKPEYYKDNKVRIQQRF